MDVDYDQIAQQAFSAATEHNWYLLLALGLFCTVAALRMLLAPKVPYFATDEGHALLTLATAVAGALVTLLAVKGTLQWSLAIGAAKIAITSHGGHLLFQHLSPLGSRIKQRAHALATRVFLERGP